MSDTRYVMVKNRADHEVGYTLKDTNQHRSFAPRETKRLPYSEIETLSWDTGGLRVLQKYLIITDGEVRKELFGTDYIEPEYLYDKEDVKKLLLKGTLDELDDCLTFGGDAIVELVVNAATELNISDIYKRNLIKEKTGFDVTRMLELAVEAETPVVEEKPIRKAAVPTAPERKASAKPSWNN